MGGYFVSAGCRVRLRGVPLARWREGYTRTLHYCVVQGYDQARHSVASVMAVCYWAGGVPPWLLVWGGLVRYRDAILASGMGTWGRSRGRHNAEAWVPVAGCGMVRDGAENRKAVSLIITLYYAVVQGLAGLYKECVPKVRSCIIDRITCQ